MTPRPASGSGRPFAFPAVDPQAFSEANADVLRAVLDCGTAPLEILDLGCGQGQGALALARLEHRVTVVDPDAGELDRLDAAARTEGLEIATTPADLPTFTPPQSYDVILADRIFGALAPAPRHATLDRLLDHVRPRGYFIVAELASYMPGLRAVFAAHPAGWRQVAERRRVCVMRSDFS